MIANRSLRRIVTDFRRHPWLHFISISTITAALVILGGFFLFSRNFDNIADKTSPHVTGTIYLREGLNDTQINLLRSQLLGFDPVHTAIFKSKGAVVAELQAFLGGAGVDTLPGTELFPDVIEVQIRPEASASAIASLKTTVARLPEVGEVDFSEDWLAQYRKVRQFVEILGVLLLVGILAGCSFIIANFMGMRHQSRKHEIDVVRLIGAHRNFILAPFMLEGLVEGFLGSVLALVILFIFKTMISAVVTVHWTSLLGVKEWLFLSPLQVLGVFAIGVAIAFCGSITVFLRFQESAS